MPSSLNFHIENESDENLPWMILVNGLFAPLESWDNCVSALTKNYRVLRYDGPGQGKSPKLNEPVYSLDLLCDALLELMDDLGIQCSSFIGLSNGGRIALRIAEKFPERANFVVAADSYHEVSELLYRKLHSWLCAHKVGGAVHRFDVATPWVWGETIVNEKPELLDFYRERASLSDSDVVQALIGGAMEKVVIDLSKVRCPVFFVVGSEDLLTPLSYHEKMNELAPNSILKVVRGGHASLLEYPQTMTEVIIPTLMREQMNKQRTKEGVNCGLD